MVDQHVFIPTTNKKDSSKKEKDDSKHAKSKCSHLKSYRWLKDEIKEVWKDVSTLTSMVYKMNDTMNRQALELSQIKQML